MHSQLLHNGTLHSTSAALLLPGQVGFLNGWGVFSTLRVTSGVLFAFERHYARMAKDAARLRIPFLLSATELEAKLLSLVAANRAQDATLRVAVIRNGGGLFEAPIALPASDMIAFTADLREWGDGAHLGYRPHARYGASPFAGSKYTSWAENLTMYETARQQGLDEFILLNEFGHVSECTSANLFAIQGDRVWTPPLSTSGCLPGITRALVLDEIRVKGLQIGERELMPADLEESDGVFMTSSTRDLYPVLRIGEHQLAHGGDRFESLRSAFLEYRSSYLQSHRRETVLV